jgi:hypothetical protein
MTLREIDLEPIRELIRRMRWQYAASVPDTPHCYSLRRWLDDPRDQAMFDRFAELIAEHGARDTFQGSSWVYLPIGGHRYWESRELYGDQTGRIINRAVNRPDAQLSLAVES